MECVFVISEKGRIVKGRNKKNLFLEKREYASETFKDGKLVLPGCS